MTPIDGQSSSSSVPPELRVVLDLALTIEGLQSATDQQKLQSALLAAPGIETIRFSENTVTLRYDPEKITQARFSELTSAVGFSISETATAPPTPPVAAPETAG